MAAPCYRRPRILAQIPRNRHTIIEANAGTGKTHTIQYLVLDLLLNTDCTVEQLLVVTFTERAAEELRSRLRALLESVLSGSAFSLADQAGDDLMMLDEAGRHKLETALFSFDRAPICTIHAFCRRILTDLAFDTGAPFGLEVVDAHRVFHRAFRAELREVLATDRSNRALLDEWMAEGETARHSNLVDSLENLLREAHFNRYSQSGASERNRRSVDELTEILDADLLKRLCARKNKKAAPASLAAADELASMVGRTDSRDSLIAALSAFDFEALNYRSNANGDVQEARLIAALDAARTACSLDARVVDRFLPLVERRLLADKRQNSEIDYGDMLEWVWNALNSERVEALAPMLRERFRFGLIDEFQDTDDLQWNIFRKIFLASKGSNILYVVGDPKQAIYSFRGADVFTYLAARREILESGGELVKLVDNYRSTKELISALNHTLDDNAALPLFTGEIRYDSPAECGRPDLHARDNDGKHLVPVTLLRYCPGDSPGSASRMRATVGRYIAATIHNILFDPHHLIAVSDRDGSRRVGPGDIYILTRTGAEAVEIGGYLREQGVPFAFYKKDGLFQTGEAYDVLDVLRAIQEPDSQSKRLKAWISPFFAVPYPDLFDCGEITAGHPLFEQLYEWKALVDQERFGVLFDQLVHRSGLVSREHFLSNNGRELTNYLHICEILLEQTWKENLSLTDIISRLESFIAGSALPAGIDSNIQRIESDRSAVQIMSVHMSKGLQAEVVFLFGGTAQPPMPPRIAVYHDEKGERQIAVGKAGREAADKILKREVREENQRLAYVAITRASTKVYLPVYPDGSTKRPLNGYYQQLNDRLNALSRELDRNETSRLVERVDISSSAYDSEAVSSQLENRIVTWFPPESVMSILKDRPSERFFEGLLARSRAMQTRSYTSLGGGMPHPLASIENETEEFKYDLDHSEKDLDLKGGRRVGIFLHEAIEKLELKSLHGIAEVSLWRAREEISDLFTGLMRRHQVDDARWFERGTEIVFNALTSRIVISADTAVGPLCECQSVREMEFVYPIPERNHALLESAGDGQWTVERGYLKGFVDFVFQAGGKYYFADWKSDFLTSYERGSLEEHVKEHYALQATIYSVGIVRLLGIRSKEEYDQRFGGLLYLFLRGMNRGGDGTAGVYFRRPSWDEICRSERDLIASIAENRTLA